jgi:major membrane immunogen (membrane-anchored lipoprotein)
MERSVVILKSIVLGLIILGSSFYSGRERPLNVSGDQDTLRKFQDGTFSGQSRYRYTDEPYWGTVSVTIKNDLITNVFFSIRDSALHEPFDSIYEKHFQGNDLYIQQCRNDWRGVQSYPGKLIKSQDINKIDAITGATWSCNIFRASLKDALEKAKRVPW